MQETTAYELILEGKPSAASQVDAQWRRYR
jgi:hypothetical protein